MAFEVVQSYFYYSNYNLFFLGGGWGINLFIENAANKLIDKNFKTWQKLAVKIDLLMQNA